MFEDVVNKQKLSAIVFEESIHISYLSDFW